MSFVDICAKYKVHRTKEATLHFEVALSIYLFTQEKKLIEHSKKYHEVEEGLTF